MNNQVYENAEKLEGVVEAGTVSGSPCVIGSRAGVALTDRDAVTGLASVSFKGAYNLTVTGATVPGTPIYYTANADPTLRLGIVATGIFFGYAWGTQAGPGAGIITVIVAEASGISTLTAGSLNGTVVANTADANVIGGIPVLHRVAVADAATGNVDVTLTHKTLVVDVWLYKTGALGGAANTIQVLNGANAITDAISINIADEAVARAGTVNDANNTIAAGGTLRITRTKVGGNAACVVFVLGLRSA